MEDFSEKQLILRKLEQKDSKHSPNFKKKQKKEKRKGEEKNLAFSALMEVYWVFLSLTKSAFFWL
jgi:hypothetical protein